MTSPLAHELRVAQGLAREAGALVLSYYHRWHGQGAGGVPVQHKQDDEPVTEADQRASQLVVAGLGAAFPDDVVLSEERVELDEERWRRAERLWLIDPIDGTKDFIAGRPGFAVMIGLLVRGRPALGVVYQPLTDVLYYGEAGQGAWCEVPDQPLQRMLVSDVSELAQARLVSSASHPADTVARLRQVAGIKDEINIGSVGIKLCLIAAGLRDLYVNPSSKTKLWDTGAPEVILQEAGGRLSDCLGGELSYREALGHGRGLMASNGPLHAAAMERLKGLLPPAWTART